MIEKIQDQLLNGLGIDLELAYYNRNIVFQLRAIQPKITEQTPRMLREYFNYMLDNSKRNTILYLSRVYDKPNDSKTRCLEKLINQLESSKKSKAPQVIADFLWDNFKKQHAKAIKHIGGKDLKSDDFLAKVKCYITATRESNGSPLFLVKTWRDKFIAHNDSDKDDPFLKDEQIEELLVIAEAAMFYISNFLGTGAAFQLKKPEGEFLKEIFVALDTKK
jgi:hypothetical protein